MMTAFFSGVSGLKSQQTSLDVIANNISNVNTTGYKAQRVSFSDVLSQTISSASSSTETRGGTNPVQIGMGVSVASIDTNMTVGSTQTTGVSTDVALTGEGFFVVQGGSQGEYQYTRAGNLSTDDAGNLTVDGYEVCGWEKYTIDADGNYVYNTDVAPESINIYSDNYNGNKKTIAAKASTGVDIVGTLDSSDTAATTATGLQAIGTTPTAFDKTSTVTVYDAQGNEYEATLNLKKCYVDSSSNTTSWYYEVATSGATLSPSSGYIAFDSNGKIISNTQTVTSLSAAIDTTTTNVAGYAASNMSLTSGLTAGSYNVSVANGTTSGTYDITLTYPDSTTQTVTGSADGAATFTTAAGTVTLTAPASLAVGATAFTVSSGTSTFDTTSTITVTPTAGATAAFAVELDFSKLSTSDITNTSSASTDASSITLTGDGYQSGELQSIAISADGTIVGTYSNGEKQSLAQIALATFTNPEGLDKIGSNLYATSNNSGDAVIVTAGSGGSGSLSSGMLEMSNVDLAEQFSSMMITQRAYQANSKIISTADEMLQSLINMVG